MSWISYNATPEDAPMDAREDWHVSDGEQVLACLCRDDAEKLAEELNTHEAEERFRPNWPAIFVYSGVACFWSGVIAMVMP